MSPSCDVSNRNNNHNYDNSKKEKKKRKKKNAQLWIQLSTVNCKAGFFHDIENLPWWQKLVWLGKPNFSSSSHKASKPRQKDSLRDLHIYVLFPTLTERQPERSPHLRVVPDPHRKTAWEISTFTCCSRPSQKDSLRDLHIYVLFLTLTDRQPERSPHLRVVLDSQRRTAWEISTFMCCSWLSAKDSLRDLHIYKLFLTPTERQPERSPHLHVFLTLTERQPERSLHLHVFLTLTERAREISTFTCCSQPSQKDSLRVRDLHIYMLFLTLTERQPERSPHLHVFLTLTERQPERSPHLRVVLDPHRKTAWEWEISTFTCCSWPPQKDSLRDLHIYMLFLTLTKRQPESERSPHLRVVLDPHRKTAWEISTFTCCSWTSQKDSLRDFHIYVLFLTLTERQPESERSPHLRVVLDPHRKTAWEISTFTCCSWPSQKDSLRDLHIYMLFLTLTKRQPERSPHLHVVLDPHKKTAWEWEISTFTCCSWPSQKDSLRDLHIYVLFLTLTERQPERSPHLHVVLDPHK